MQKKKKAIIFGTGVLGELVDFYLENDSDYSVKAFCATNPNTETFCGKPLLEFESIEEYYSPQAYEMFVAVGYRQMNNFRKIFCEKARAKGYTLLSYISSKATFWNKANKIGNNVFIFEDNTIQPFVEIGNGSILWSGNHIGHHSKIQDYCFLTSHVVVSGFCSIGSQSFIGVNATLADGVSIGEKALVGAGATVSKNLQPNKVILGSKSDILSKNSNFFLR